MGGFTVDPERLARARARIAASRSTPAQGFTAAPPTQTEPEEERGSIFGFIPQPIRNIGGAIGGFLGAVDKPISERLGISVPEMRGPVDEIANIALQELTRPTNALFALGGPGVAAKLSASGSRVGRAAAALAAPAIAGSPLTRITGEVALSGGARAASEASAERLQDAPLPIRIIAPLAAGLLGGAAAAGAARGSLAALSRQQASAIAGADLPDLGHRFAHALPDFNQVKASVKTADNPIVKRLLDDPLFRINPSAAVDSESGKNYIAYLRQTGRGEQLANLAVDSSFDIFDARWSGENAAGFGGRLFDIRGGRARTPNGKQVQWNDIFSDPHAKAKYALSGEQDEFISTYRATVEEIEQLRRAAGLPAREFTKDDWYYVPRSVKGVGDREFRSPSKASLSRVFELAEEGLAKGADYEDPRNTLRLHAQAAYQEIVEKQFSDAMEELAVSPKAILRKTKPQLVDAYEKELKNVQSLQREFRSEIAKGNRERVRGLTDELSVARQTKEKARSAYKNALEQTRNKEYLPEYVFGRSSSDELIPVGKWKGRFLPRDEDYKLLSERMDTITGRAKRDQVSLLAQGSKEIVDTVRFWASVGDFAAPMIQGLPLLGRNPKAWARMVKAQYTAVFDPSIQARYIQSNRDTVRKMAQAGVPLGEVELFSAVERPGSLLHKMVPARAQKALAESPAPIRNVNLVGRLMAGYNHSLLVARTELWKSLEKSMGTEDLARYIRNMTGALDSRALGVAPSRRAAEGMWMAFSPRLLRSTFALVGSAASPETPVGREAARAILGLASSATLFYAITGVALGKSAEEIEAGLNPLNGRKFLAHEINGDWIGVGGQVRAISQFMAKAIANPEGLATADQFENPLINFYTSRGAPAVNIIGGVVEAATDEKVNVLPFENIDSLPDLMKHIGTSAIPFSIQGQLEGEETSTLAFAMTGFRTSQETASDALNAISQQRYGKNYSDILPIQQQEIENDRPDLIQKRNEMGSREQRILRQKSDQITQERITAEDQLVAALQQGRMSQKEFADGIEQLQFATTVRNQQLFDDFGQEYESDDPRRVALSAWFNTYRLAEVAPNTGVIDWERRDTLERELFSSLTPEQIEYIENRKVREHNAAQGYFDAKKVISESDYYPIQDEVYERAKALVSSVLGKKPETYADMLALRNIALSQGDTATAKRIDQLVSRIGRSVSQRRELLRRQNPELNQALILTGRVSPTSRLALSLR